jgi:hypothetical protein
MFPNPSIAITIASVLKVVKKVFIIKCVLSNCFKQLFIVVLIIILNIIVIFYLCSAYYGSEAETLTVFSPWISPTVIQIAPFQGRIPQIGFSRNHTELYGGIVNWK